MFDHPKFLVNLTIAKVTRIPYSVGHIFVRWNVTDSPRPDAHGRTVSEPIDQSEASFDYKAQFHQRIGVRSNNRELRSCNIKFEIIWITEGNRSITLGTLNLNLSEFACKHVRKKHNKMSEFIGSDVPNSDTDSAAYGRLLLYMLSGARINSLLQLQIEVNPIHSDADFTVPLFCGPSVNFNSEAVNEEDGTGKARGFRTISGDSSRAKIRALRHAVMIDIMKDNSSKIDEFPSLNPVLMGQTERLESDIPKEEFEKYHILSLPDGPEIVHLKEARPYQEVEIRDTFSTWGDYK